jgi:hypothetical protein
MALCPLGAHGPSGNYLLDQLARTLASRSPVSARGVLRGGHGPVRLSQ